MICFKILTALMLMTAMPAWTQELLLVVHPETKIEELSQKDIQKIYLNRKKFWNDGASIKAANLKIGEIHKHFLNTYVKKTEQQYSTYWKRLIFTGKGAPPKSFAEVADLLTYVATTPGAVGYVPKGVDLTGVKILTLQ